jgi:hypothetical protein
MPHKLSQPLCSSQWKMLHKRICLPDPLSAK